MPTDGYNPARYPYRFERSCQVGLIHSGTSEESGASTSLAAGRLPLDERLEIGLRGGIAVVIYLLS